MTQDPRQLSIVERPTALSIGLILLGLKSVFFLFLCGLGTAAAPLISLIGMSESHGDDAIPIFFVGGFITVLFAFFFLVQAFTLFACYRAWKLRRTWLWVVIALAAFSLIDTSFFGLAIAIPVIIGAIQALERTEPRVVVAAPA